METEWGTGKNQRNSGSRGAGFGDGASSCDVETLSHPGYLSYRRSWGYGRSRSRFDSTSNIAGMVDDPQRCCMRDFVGMLIWKGIRRKLVAVGTAAAGQHNLLRQPNFTCDKLNCFRSSMFHRTLDILYRRLDLQRNTAFAAAT